MKEEVHYKGTYEVLPAAEVSLNVLIGFAQLGSSIAFFKHDPINVWVGGIKDLKLGSGSQLDGKTLLIETTVTDFNPHSNMTSVHAVLSGGAASEPGVFGAAKETKEKGTVTYVGTIDFTL